MESADGYAGGNLVTVFELVFNVEAIMADFFGWFEFENGEVLQLEQFAACWKFDLFSLKAAGSLLYFFGGFQEWDSEGEPFSEGFSERDGFEFKLELILYIHIIVKLNLYKFCWTIITHKIHIHI